MQHTSEKFPVDQELANKVLEIVQKCIDEFSLNKDVVAKPALSMEQTELDSLSIMELVTEIEDAFSIELPDDSADRIDDIGGLIQIVNECVVDQ